MISKDMNLDTVAIMQPLKRIYTGIHCFLFFLLSSEGTDTTETTRDGNDFDSDSESSDSDENDETLTEEEKEKAKKKEKKILTEEEKKRRQKMKKEKVINNQLMLTQYINVLFLRIDEQCIKEKKKS